MLYVDSTLKLKFAIKECVSVSTIFFIKQCLVLKMPPWWFCQIYNGSHSMMVLLKPIHLMELSFTASSPKSQV